MAGCVPCYLLSTLLILSLLSFPAFAVPKAYVVYMGEHSHGADPTAADLDIATNSHYDLLGSYVGSQEKAKEKIFYSYTHIINGFAAMLEEEEASELAKHPNVVSVFLNKGRQLHTTRSWDFLRLERDGIIPSGSLWTKARFGQDVIIGNLDTGVWSESESFKDESMGPIPSRWRGTCQDDTEEPVKCNRKLIGARYFNKGYLAFVGDESNNTVTARDLEGHGTHTLSTAGGSPVSGANIFGYGNGTARGGSPNARVAAYKVCWKPVGGAECFDSDILKAFDTAIWDGVDVLSVSLGGSPSEFFQDGISIGAFHAVRRGIVVVASAGNSGPDAGTASNLSPWIFTVGASTIDREFISTVTLGNKKIYQGASLSAKSLPEKFYPLISAKDAKAANASALEAAQCEAGSLDSKKVKGKIIVCIRGVNGRAEKGAVAYLAGAVGMILANDEKSGNEIIPDPHFLPASHINYSDGQAVYAYIKSTKNPVAQISPVKTDMPVKPAPFMAAFSSRGPNVLDPAILKPDITAPGVSIIAAFTGATGPIESDLDKRRVPFITMSGTSMSCPHVSGIVGLLKNLHPEWSPAAIKSAIMTSARIRDNEAEAMLDSDNNKANPFGYGAGHVRPNRAMDPGLVYDMNEDDYLNYLCGRGYNQTNLRFFTRKNYTCPKSFTLASFNYPSMAVPDLDGKATLTRRVKNVGGGPATYTARVKAPAGVSVAVKPASLKFEKDGEEKRFEVVVEAKGLEGKKRDYVFGQLTWTDGKHNVRSPIVVKHV